MTIPDSVASSRFALRNFTKTIAPMKNNTRPAAAIPKPAATHGIPPDVVESPVVSLTLPSLASNGADSLLTLNSQILTSYYYVPRFQKYQ
jgi:hypothetical protein